MIDQSNKFLRKSDVAARYGVTARTVDRMADDGRLPTPIYHGSRVPRWAQHELDEADARATRERPAKEAAR
jgi:predicted DNA-binding transcriptional regulator AlpA